MKTPVRVTITGAAGQIGYQLAFRIASGQMLGSEQPIILQLLEIPPALPALQGVVMELDDCAFSSLAGIVATDEPNIAFKDSDYALLVGARPRGPGMERKDLLQANAAIFSVQGKAMNDHASRDIKVLVVGNPANTNALIASTLMSRVVMELDDCAFSSLAGIVATDEPNIAFKDSDYALLVGARPRGPGMERKDLLQANAAIFSVQGKAMNDHASRDIKVLVVGNPANTNALIASSNAPDIDSSNFTAMTRLDHNRALAKLAAKTGSHVNDIQRMTIWGNHSATQYPDITHARVAGNDAAGLVGEDWLTDEFIPTVQQRGAAIIAARGASSAASAASAAIDHMRDWVQGTADGDWVSMAVPADGSYGIESGIVYSYPVRCISGKYEIVQGLDINDFSRARMAATETELREERAAIEELL